MTSFQQLTYYYFLCQLQCHNSQTWSSNFLLQIIIQLTCPFAQQPKFPEVTNDVKVIQTTQLNSGAKQGNSTGSILVQHQFLQKLAVPVAVITCKGNEPVSIMETTFQKRPLSHSSWILRTLFCLSEDRVLPKRLNISSRKCCLWI